ncbi:TPA: hypothetical protein HA235_05275 [Candidatus Woesearchaeota archaeon]|nr:hypothetical protein [Candidatus Woesearchaeota archaeon]HIH32091.1 hypothetical protein [Candidatus Woesearchaeota archaeon]HIH54919.1 hypothetical protein [Candidatus Woesearchaeota archaeon]HIJ01790.1 hypothetical protein [Candidatus Woesearchaeota archaeon]HIJ14037.1 hypothetical protein [Candidatus Woesearchaeota archaeon]
MVENNKQAAKNAAKSAADLKKQKKKKWCPIIAPDLFSNRVLGESLLDDASQLMNRTITVNMMQLLGDMKKQNINMMFKVVDVKEGKGLTEPMKFEVSQSSTRRLARREKDKLMDSFVVKTGDNKLIRIKTIMITNNATKGKVQTALIKNCRYACKELINATTFTNLFYDLVNGKFQKQVKDALHKTYPLRILEIRLVELERRKKKESIEEQELLKLKEQKELASEEETEVEEKNDQSGV